MILLSGLLIGILFGFLTQKGEVLRYDRQVGAMLLKDMTIFKFMLSAIFVAAVGLLLLQQAAVIELTHEPFSWVGVILGGAIFGIGWGLLGHCPGTAMGALGEGRLDAVAGLIGMLIGGVLFAPMYPAVTRWYTESQAGNPNLVSWLGSPVFAIVALGLAISSLFWLFHKKQL